MDLRGLKDQAARLSAEGRLEKAQLLYQQLLSLNPRDPSLWVRNAEVLKRLERREAAVSSYRMAAQLLMNLGHGHRAVACLKLALEQHPNDVEIVTELIRYELKQRQDERAHPHHAAGPLPVVAMFPHQASPPVPVESQARWPQVRRLAEGEVGIKPSPFSPWVVITSSAAIEVRFLEDYAVDEGAPWLEPPSK